MHCTNCGREIDPNASVCVSCGVAVGTQKKFCVNCGKAVTPEQAVCVGCGCALANGGANAGSAVNKTMSANGKSASVATILSCVIPGVGQIYLGQMVKGVAMIVASSVFSFIGWELFWPAFFIAVPLWVVAMIDANGIGRKLEAGKSVGEWEFF